MGKKRTRMKTRRILRAANWNEATCEGAYGGACVGESGVQLDSEFEEVLTDPSRVRLQ